MNPPQAFDPLASTYDSDFTNTAIGRYLRGRVQARLEQHFRAGDHVLELGCGTGEDARWLAGRGVAVLATDASAAMLDITRAKAAGNSLVQVARLDISALTPRPPLPQVEGEQSVLEVPLHEGEGFRARAAFDGVFASFGPLNCLPDWKPLAAWLAERVKPGGVAAFGVMSPLCLWEVLWHSAHGDFRTAFRRWRRAGAIFEPLPLSPYTERGKSPHPRSFSLRARGEEQPYLTAIPIQYPTIRRLTRDFAPCFRRMHVEPLGVFLPPSDVYGVIEKRPHLLKRLVSLEERFGKYGQLALLADHYWIEFERTSC